MQRRPLPHAPFDVSLLTLGTMTWGEQNTEAEAHAQMDWAVAQGIDCIDTAEMYPVPPGPATQGRTETYMGTWLRNPSKRRSVKLFTKIAGPGRRDWIRNGDTQPTKKNIHWACEDSLKRLQTDVIDLFQIHWPSRNVAAFGTWQFNPKKEFDYTPLLEQAEAMSELIKAGKIRAWGVSNESSWGVTRFMALCELHGLPKPASIQNAYHLGNRLVEADLAEVMFRERIPLLAYSPLSMGVLTGKYDGLTASPESRLLKFPAFGERFKRPAMMAAGAEYNALAKRHGLTPTGLALSFVCHQWFVGSCIIGATSLKQLDEQLAAYQHPLTDEVLKQIDAIALRYAHPAA